jgi:phosphoribosylamine-glycine ligase
MGAYSPAPVVTRALHERIMREVIEPTIRGLAEGRYAVIPIPLCRNHGAP